MTDASGNPFSEELDRFDRLIAEMVERNPLLAEQDEQAFITQCFDALVGMGTEVPENETETAESRCWWMQAIRFAVWRARLGPEAAMEKIMAEMVANGNVLDLGGGRRIITAKNSRLDVSGWKELFEKNEERKQ
jgi:hypothetical protein